MNDKRIVGRRFLGWWRSEIELLLLNLFDKFVVGIDFIFILFVFFIIFWENCKYINGLLVSF